jgi:type 1 glutamine amidotransferase
VDARRGKRAGASADPTGDPLRTAFARRQEPGAPATNPCLRGLRGIPPNARRYQRHPQPMRPLTRATRGLAALEETMRERLTGLIPLGVALLGGLIPMASAAGADEFVVYEGQDGPGKGKHIVLVTGDEEYRSEESMPQLAKILATQHGFTCTVLFAINKETGEIDPETVDNIPGLEALDTADMMVMFTRFRELPDEQMKHIIDYTNSGRPIMGLRTATHAFFYKDHMDSPYAKWTWNSTGEIPGGWGRAVLGETWVCHYGDHQIQSTRGVVAEGQEDNPIVRGCEDIWGPSDVYGITTLNGDCTPIIMGEVLVGMNPTDEVFTDKPAIPVAWTKTYTGTEGKAARVFETTMGHGGDLKSEGFRRLLVNGIYWALGMEDAIPERAEVGLVGEYDPADIGFAGHKRGLRPEDHRL